MSAPHDMPSAAELVEAVREWLERDVLTGTQGRLQFHTRVAINVLSMVERELIVRALEKTQGNVTHTARLLQISRKSLQTKMKELGLREEG